MQETPSRRVFVRVGETTRRDPRAVLRLRLRAAPAASSTVRAEVGRWLTGLGISWGDVLDLQLACSEAVTLVMDGSAGPAGLVLDVEGELDGSTATVSIRDYGLCCEDRPDRELETFGLALIQATVDELELRAYPGGLGAVLRRRVRFSRAGCGRPTACRRVASSSAPSSSCRLAPYASASPSCGRRSSPRPLRSP